MLQHNSPPHAKATSVGLSCTVGQANRDRPGYRRSPYINVISSARVEDFVRKQPFMAEVTQTEPGLRTPRMVMQVCTASITTPTPFA